MSDTEINLCDVNMQLRRFSTKSDPSKICRCSPEASEISIYKCNSDINEKFDRERVSNCKAVYVIIVYLYNRMAVISSQSHCAKRVYLAGIDMSLLLFVHGTNLTSLVSVYRVLQTSSVNQ